MGEIKKLTMKAIASLPSSGNPNSSTTAAVISRGGGRVGGKLKCPKSRKEGEASSCDDAELAPCSVAPANSANPGMQLRQSQNYPKLYIKHIKRKQFPFRSSRSRAFHWHAKESNNNLVISFSDDDSGSDSEDLHSNKKAARRVDSTSIEHGSMIPEASLLKPTSSIEPSIENGPLICRQKLFSKTPIIPEVGNLRDSSMADQRLELLCRRQVVAQENRLKMEQKGATVASGSNQYNVQETGIRRQVYDTTMEIEVNSPSKKRLKHDESSCFFDFDASSKPENDRKLCAENSYPLHQLENRVNSCGEDSFLGLFAVNPHDGTISENDNVEKIMANTTGEESMPFHSLMKMEELYNKELEEAQEYRHKCEIEEMHALKAYRKAQRSLVEANERCAVLCKKREIIFAKFRSFVTKTSQSDCSSDWLCQQPPHEDGFFEPDACVSAHVSNRLLDGTVSPTNDPNMLADDRVSVSRSAQVDDQIEKAHLQDNSQENELLEASLRSALVARLGLREFSKTNGASKGEVNTEKRADIVAENIESSLFSGEMIPRTEAKETAELNGISCTKRPQENNLLLSSKEELQSNADLLPSNSLPASGLHSICRHACMIFPKCHTENFSTKENDNIEKSKEMGLAECIPDVIVNTMNFERLFPPVFRNLRESSVEIDPFWPLCTFELRGKCNDEECPWQHMTAVKSANSRSDINASCLPNGKIDASKFHVLPIPTYQIGRYLINADSHLSQSVLARSSWQYHQRGFCASFSIPFSIQRILPIDAPCLPPGDDTVADNYSRNRPSLYRWNQDDTSSFKEQFEKDSGEVEHFLEMALDQFDGELCERDRKKALSLLARGIESYPSSEVLWVIYLHIYYRKEKAVGKDDMFLRAVQHAKGSYDLWLLFINSRVLWDDRLNAYDLALNELCHIEDCESSKHFSPFIFDIFVQMIDFLCMSGHPDEAIRRICGLSPLNELQNCTGGDLLRDIGTHLTVSDRCLFWVLCAYVLVYEKLPKAILQQIEFVKTLPFDLEWPHARLVSDKKMLALELMKSAMTEMASYFDDNTIDFDQASFRSLHFLAVSHVKCQAALHGSSGCHELLEKYLKLHPLCVELVLMAVRFRETNAMDVDFSAFEDALRCWPNKIPGIQCLWNQYAEFVLTKNRINLAEKLMACWFENFPKFCDLSGFPLPITEGSFGPLLQSKAKDDAFGFLNLFLHHVLQKSASNAHRAIEKSLELAAPEDYDHFVNEHALFVSSNYTKSSNLFPLEILSPLFSRYLSDCRSTFLFAPLSQRFIRRIKKPRIQHMVGHIVGNVSMTPALVNSVLRVCYGTSLLPDKLKDIKEAVCLVDFIMELTPANYEFALSAYRICCRNFGSSCPDCISVRFWACTLLVNSIFYAVPVAPEHAWLEAANAIKISERLDICLRFHEQAVSVYPFSVNLWKSYSNAGNAHEIVEAARGRGIELNEIMDAL